MEEDLKRKWKETRFNNPGINQMESVVNGKRHTALQRLADRYKRFSIVGVLLSAYSICLMFNHIFPEQSRLYIGILFLFGTSVSATVDYNLYKRVKRLNVAEMNTSEIIREIYSVRKIHLLYLFFGIPWAATTIGYIAYCCAENAYLMWGILCGTIIGLCIGIYNLLQFLHDFREISNEN